MRFIAVDYGDQKGTIVTLMADLENGHMTVLAMSTHDEPDCFRPYIAEVPKNCDNPPQ